jgi:hypothetical protein
MWRELAAGPGLQLLPHGICLPKKIEELRRLLEVRVEQEMSCRSEANLTSPLKGKCGTLFPLVDGKVQVYLIDLTRKRAGLIDHELPKLCEGLDISLCS